MAEQSFHQALMAVKDELQLNYDLREIQIKCIKESTSGKHVFCSLPTGMGKSDIMVFPSLILDKVSS